MSVFCWGLGKSGQLGTGSSSTCHTPKLINVKNVIGSATVTQISSGGLFTCCLTSDGRVVSFGCGKHGRLGNGSDDDSLLPGLVKFPPETKIVQVSCGSWHGAALSETGQVFTWGHPRACGLGGSSGEPRGFFTPSPLQTFTDSSPAGVSCGHNYTLVWTCDGQAFSWGCGRHGVLGQGSESDVSTPKKIESLKDVTFMNAGYAHAGAVTSKGDVYMFGKGKDGALGFGEGYVKDALMPRRVEDLSEKIEEISCSVGEHHGHTIAVTSEGVVFSWGDGYKGKLGLGDQETRALPVRIDNSSFSGESILHVSAGGIHSSAVSRSGHVFTWGCGSDGRLGHPDGKGHRYLFRSDFPRVVEHFHSNQVAKDINCSYYHTVALVIDKKDNTS